MMRSTTSHPGTNIERVDGRYTLKEILDTGSHVVYRARDLIKGRDVAVKLEHCTQDLSSLEHEFHVLKKLQGGTGFLQPVFFGRELSYRALVLNDVATPLCDILTSQGGHLDPDVVLTVGHQLVHRLEHVHSHDYIHCDIKPQNVLIGTNTSNYTVFLIDFGIAFQYRHSATRAHVPCQQGCHFVGTPSFTSINHHLGIQSTRRDDLESLAYTLIYLLQGSLPWFSSIHPDLSNDSILKLKQDTAVDELCDGLPELATFLHYSRSLAYTAKPDYDYLRSLLHHRVLNVSTSHGLLDFSVTDHKRPTPPPYNRYEGICDSSVSLVTTPSTPVSMESTNRQKTYSGHSDINAKGQRKKRARQSTQNQYCFTPCRSSWLAQAQAC
ncbi:Protein kinase-like domain containing protein [Tylopilus felleus]